MKFSFACMSSLSTQLGHNKNTNNINEQKSSFVQQVQLFKNSLQTDKNADKHKYIFNMFHIASSN